MKKLGIILMTIAFLFSTFDLLPVKQASAHTGEERPMLMAAWPWEYYRNLNGSNHNSGSSIQQHQVKNQKDLQKSNGTTTRPYNTKGQRTHQRDKGLRGWFFKISLYLRILFRQGIGR